MGNIEMPIYELKCSTCNHKKDTLLSVSSMEENEKNPMDCPECGKGKLTRAVSAPMVQTRASEFDRAKIT